MEQVNTKMAQLEKELELAQEIYADQEYIKILENSALQARSKRSFWNRGLLQALKLMFSSKKT